jgi:tRNA pseudouridine55 synthase
VGHAGTLDPFASGLLVAGVEQGTRILQHLVDLPKEYEGTIRLGVVTDTQDPTGKVLRESPVGSIPRGRVLEEMERLTGTIEQVPPMASALRVGGERLYEIHRRGGHVDRAPRAVRVERWDLLSLDLPLVRFRVRCSRGTYVRTLGHDLGERLGPGGHLASLRRTRIGSFRVEDALRPEELAALRSPDDLGERRIPLARAVAHLPALDVEDRAVPRIASGIPPEPSDFLDPSALASLPPGRPVALLARDGRLLAVAQVRGEGEGGEAAAHTGPRFAFVSVFAGPETRSGSPDPGAP